MTEDRKMMRHSHAVPSGRSLIERIQVQMDKRREAMAQRIVEVGSETLVSPEYQRVLGRYEGLAAALSILRSSSLKEEIHRSNERLGIENS